jgi:diketogulonate reductase-like aldo/keto reductase
MNTTPTFIYGTAWKEDLTRECILIALQAGFRAIDTANQRKHYFEEAVGDAIAIAHSKLGIKRDDLFLQTKFTFSRGQDHRKPYEDSDPIATQVEKSFTSSLKHLGTDYLDSLILHGPQMRAGLTNGDWEAWRAMESIQRRGGARKIGTSNMALDQIEELYDKAEIKPSYLQNRCFAETRWDQVIRAYCSKHGIAYQGFSLLTANSRYLGGSVIRPRERNLPQLVFSGNSEVPEAIQKILDQTERNIEQVIFRFVQQVGMIPITGSRSEAHLRNDLEVSEFSLSPSQLETIENIAFLN